MLAVAHWWSQTSQCRIDAASGALHGLGPCFQCCRGVFRRHHPADRQLVGEQQWNPLLPGYWVAFAGAITLITALWFTPESCRSPCSAYDKEAAVEPCMKKWLPILSLGLTQFVMVLDGTVMNVSITEVVGDLGTTTSNMQLAIATFTLTMAALMLAGAGLGTA